MIPKLRVWDTVKKAMHDVQAIVYTEERVYPVYSKKIRRYIPFCEAILMQSTGLFDKNGVEIFEGDVVRYTWDTPSDVNATEKGNKVRISKVFWSDWRASWAVGKKFCNTDLFRYARNGKTVEIIGNIYENPDLREV